MSDCDLPGDPGKAWGNRRDHGVSFEVAARVWRDPLHVILPDRWQEGEERWHAIGRVGGATLLVVHSYPGGDEPVIKHHLGPTGHAAREASL